MIKPASYIPNKMKIVAIKGLSADTKALKLEFSDCEAVKNFTFTPGQFIVLSIDGFGEGAFGLTTSVKELPVIEVAVRSVGNTTRAIHRLKVGDEIGLRGPYGKGFPITEMAGKEVLVIAGGLGLAPLRSLIHYFRDEKIKTSPLKIFFGAKTPNDLIYKDEFREWEKFAENYFCVNQADSDWKGQLGFVTDLLSLTKIDKEAIAILCGPPVMFKPVIDKLKSFGVGENQVFVLLERRMKCGIGKCQHCTCGDKYVCLDGPTFRYSEIKDNWEALA
jgi:NAD(P)H-flavin reductase